MKKIFKEIVYLGLGAAVLTKNKGLELLEKLVSKNHTTRDEGEKIITDLKNRMEVAKAKTDEQMQDFMNRFVEETNLAKDEVREAIEQMLKKPKKAKKQVLDKTHALSEKIVEKTTMNMDQANDLLHNFLDEIMTIKSEAKKEGKKLSHQISRMSNQGKAIAEDLEIKAKVLLKEAKPRTQNAMDKVIDRLHLASNEEVHSLEKRVKKLEKKEISK